MRENIILKARQNSRGKERSPIDVGNRFKTTDLSPSRKVKGKKLTQK